MSSFLPVKSYDYRLNIVIHLLKLIYMPGELFICQDKLLINYLWGMVIICGRIIAQFYTKIVKVLFKVNCQIRLDSQLWISFILH